MEAFLPTTPVYALLVWYGILCWRVLQPGVSFRAQLRKLRGAILWFALAWLILTFGFYIVAQLLCAGNCDPQVLFWVTLLPFLPMHLGLFVLNLLIPPALAEFALIVFGVFYGSELVAAL